VGLPTPITTALNYGVLAPDGSLDVRLTFDHRVMDGGTAARALAELEGVLNGELFDEVSRLGPRAAWAADSALPDDELAAVETGAE
jgi:hypothetical protein